MYGDHFIVERLVQFDASATDIFPDQFNHGNRVEIVLRFEVVRAFPAHGTGTVTAFSQHEAFAIEFVYLVVEVTGDLCCLGVVAVEVAVIRHVVVLGRERPGLASGVEHFAHGGDGEREELRFARVHGVKHVFVRPVEEQACFQVFHLVLQFFLHPLNRVHEFFRGDSHVVARVNRRVNRGLQGFRHHAHLGEHFPSFLHHEGNIYPDRAMFHAASAHGASPEKGIDHLVAHLPVQFPGAEQFWERGSLPCPVAPVNGADEVYFSRRDELAFFHGEIVHATICAQPATHA